MIVGLVEYLFYDKILFVLFIIEVFNFEISIFKKFIFCFFFGIIVVIKELLFFGIVFFIMVEIVIIYCFYFVFNKVWRKEGLCVIYYIVVFIELLLFGYE